jgi:hypothetical protein
MVVVWELHYIAGPGVSLVLEYSFAALGTASVAYGVYNRFTPPAFPDLAIWKSGNETTEETFGSVEILLIRQNMV